MQVALRNSDSPASLPVVDTDSDVVQQARKDLFDSQVQDQAKIHLRHTKEKAQIDQEAEEEKQRTFLTLEEQSVQQMMQAIKKKELEFQKELAERQNHISVDESDKLIAAHQKEMQVLKENLKVEKQQQKQVLIILTNVTQHTINGCSTS